MNKNQKHLTGCIILPIEECVKINEKLDKKIEAFQKKVNSQINTEKAINKMELTSSSKRLNANINDSEALYKTIDRYGNKMTHVDQHYGTCTSQSIKSMLEMVSITQGKLTPYSSAFIYGNRNGFTNPPVVVGYKPVSSEGEGLIMSQAAARLVRDGCLTLDECDRLGYSSLKIEHDYTPGGSETIGARALVQGDRKKGIRGALCPSLPTSYKHRPIGRNFIDPRSSIFTNDIKNNLINYSPVIISMLARDIFAANNTRGILTDHPLTSGAVDGHAITIFGWTHINGKEYFKVWNSWGDNKSEPGRCGDDGCFYIPTAAASEYILEAYSFEFNPDPSIVGEFKPGTNMPQPGQGDYYLGYIGNFSDGTTPGALNGMFGLGADKVFTTPINFYECALNNKTMFIADRVCLTNVSYDTLNSKGFVKGNNSKKIKCLSNDEYDMFLGNYNDYIKIPDAVNDEKYSFLNYYCALGSDQCWIRKGLGNNDDNKDIVSKSLKNKDYGFRPVIDQNL